MSKKLKLNLRHRRHNVRLLSHKHTSYGALCLILVLFGLILVVMTTVESTRALTLTESGSINVAGLVKGPPPTTPAVISQPTNNQTFATNLIAVNGTCGSGLLVKIFRNGTLAGSMICQGDGTFSIMIQLTGGSNLLQARNYDFADQAGPDSPGVTVFYSVASSGSSDGLSGESTIISSTNTGEQAAIESKENFLVTTDTAVKGITVGNEVSWKFVLSGGNPPYALLINWGDGQQDLKSYSKNGEILLKHKYTKAGVYKITVKATDSAGRVAYMETTAVIQKSGFFGITSKFLPDTDRTDYFYFAWWVLLSIGLIILAFWLGEKYELKWLIKHRMINKP